MSNQSVKPSDLAAAIMNELDNYTEEVQANIIDVTKQILKDARTDVSAKSPRRFGDYAKGWSVKFVKGKGSVSGAVHNATRYRLTHLLEHGHVTKNGTDRKFDDTPAHPHIGSVNDAAQKAFEEAIKEAIANG